MNRMSTDDGNAVVTYVVQNRDFNTEGEWSTETETAAGKRLELIE